jgi:hypothetical protein
MEIAMKRLMICLLLSVALSGCIVAPDGGYGRGYYGGHGGGWSDHGGGHEDNVRARNWGRGR